MNLNVLINSIYYILYAHFSCDNKSISLDHNTYDYMYPPFSSHPQPWKVLVTLWKMFNIWEYFCLTEAKIVIGEAKYRYYERKLRDNAREKSLWACEIVQDLRDVRLLVLTFSGGSYSNILNVILGFPFADSKGSLE